MEDGAIVDLYLRRDEEAIRQTSLKYGSRLRAPILLLHGLGNHRQKIRIFRQ